MNQNQSCELNIDCPFSLAKKHDIHKPWTLKTKSIASCQKSQIIRCSVIHFSKNERASEVCTMESSQKLDFPIFEAFLSNVEIKGLPGPKKKIKNKIWPLTQREKRKFFYWLYILIFRGASFSFKNSTFLITYPNWQVLN